MRFTQIFAVSPKRLVSIAVASITALAAVAVIATGASASSGGIGTSGVGGIPAEPTGSPQASSADVSSAKYRRLWAKVSPADKQWARATSDCESGHDPDAIGGGGIYRGAFQFTKETWSASPKTPGGDPIDYDYATQAVVAVNLKLRDGTGHWPVCG